MKYKYQSVGKLYPWTFQDIPRETYNSCTYLHIFAHETSIHCLLFFPDALRPFLRSLIVSLARIIGPIFAVHMFEQLQEARRKSITSKRADPQDEAIIH